MRSSTPRRDREPAAIPAFSSLTPGARVFRMSLFAMFGALIFASKLAFEALPNIHPVALLIVSFTVVYRVYALIPLYVFVAISGVYFGFGVFWVPYLYIWTALWGMAMLVPRRLPPAAAAVVFPLVCALHGLAYGTLYAPFQALAFGYDFQKTLAWIAAGLPFDAVHALGNLAMGLLVFPLTRLLFRLEASYGRRR